MNYSTQTKIAHEHHIRDWLLDGRPLPKNVRDAGEVETDALSFVRAQPSLLPGLFQHALPKGDEPQSRAVRERIAELADRCLKTPATAADLVRPNPDGCLSGLLSDAPTPEWGPRPRTLWRILAASAAAESRAAAGRSLSPAEKVVLAMVMVRAVHSNSDPVTWIPDAWTAAGVKPQTLEFLDNELRTVGWPKSFPVDEQRAEACFQAIATPDAQGTPLNRDLLELLTELKWIISPKEKEDRAKLEKMIGASTDLVVQASKRLLLSDSPLRDQLLEKLSVSLAEVGNRSRADHLRAWQAIARTSRDAQARITRVLLDESALLITSKGGVNELLAALTALALCGVDVQSWVSSAGLNELSRPAISAWEQANWGFFNTDRMAVPARVPATDPIPENMPNKTDWSAWLGRAKESLRREEHERKLRREEMEQQARRQRVAAAFKSCPPGLASMLQQHAEAPLQLHDQAQQAYTRMVDDRVPLEELTAEQELRLLAEWNRRSPDDGHAAEELNSALGRRTRELRARLNENGVNIDLTDAAGQLASALQADREPTGLALSIMTGEPPPRSPLGAVVVPKHIGGLDKIDVRRHRLRTAIATGLAIIALIWVGWPFLRATPQARALPTPAAKGKVSVMLEKYGLIQHGDALSRRAAPIDRSTYALLAVSDIPGTPSGPARVSAPEAARWCRRLNDLVRACDATAFDEGSPYAGLEIRLPLPQELEGVNAREPEWVLDSAGHPALLKRADEPPQTDIATLQLGAFRPVLGRIVGKAGSP